MAEANQDEIWMRRAIELSLRGEGRVEPNPMVGCVLVKGGEVIGEGWHQEFGGPHAEVQAIGNAGAADGVVAGANEAEGATAYVTLEPCSHHGKTPPCSQALIKARVARVVIACHDPNPQVAGQGKKDLEEAGITVQSGVLEVEARQVLAPYLKRTETGLPWIIAKWAMTLDGKIACASGDSKWISNARSRAIAHKIRGRVDAVMVGSGTALADDPLLTARPEDQSDVFRKAIRVVVDSKGSLPSESKLCQTANHKTLVLIGPECTDENQSRLRACGCDVLVSEKESHNERLLEWLKELGDRGVTNVLVEGGGGLIGGLFELGQIDEVHAFVAAKIVGGVDAPSPVGGTGNALMSEATELRIRSSQLIDNDLYLIARRP